ncbi:MAG: hypothetical protein EOP49_23515, partial [Sphingobacteriales bacterium]
LAACRGATSATCTPSRFSLLTGTYAWRKKRATGWAALTLYSIRQFNLRSEPLYLLHLVFQLFSYPGCHAPYASTPRFLS